MIETKMVIRLATKCRIRKYSFITLNGFLLFLFFCYIDIFDCQVLPLSESRIVDRVSENCVMEGGDTTKLSVHSNCNEKGVSPEVSFWRPLSEDKNEWGITTTSLRFLTLERPKLVGQWEQVLESDTMKARLKFLPDDPPFTIILEVYTPSLNYYFELMDEFYEYISKVVSIKNDFTTIGKYIYMNYGWYVPKQSVSIVESKKHLLKDKPISYDYSIAHEMYDAYQHNEHDIVRHNEIEEMVEEVEYLHSLDFVHLRIVPRSFYFPDYYAVPYIPTRLLLGDFTALKLVNQAENPLIGEKMLTNDKIVEIDHMFRPPEYWKDMKNEVEFIYTKKFDVYSLGITIASMRQERTGNGNGATNTAFKDNMPLGKGISNIVDSTTNEEERNKQIMKLFEDCIGDGSKLDCITKYYEPDGEADQHGYDKTTDKWVKDLVRVLVIINPDDRPDMKKVQDILNDTHDRDVRSKKFQEIYETHRRRLLKFIGENWMAPLKAKQAADHAETRTYTDMPLSKEITPDSRTSLTPDEERTTYSVKESCSSPPSTSVGAATLSKGIRSYYIKVPSKKVYYSRGISSRSKHLLSSSYYLGYLIIIVCIIGL